MVKDHSDRERGNPPQPHGLLFSIKSKDNTYHGLCYTSRGALAGTRNSSMGQLHEGSIRRPPLTNVGFPCRARCADSWCVPEHTIPSFTTNTTHLSETPLAEFVTFPSFPTQRSQGSLWCIRWCPKNTTKINSINYTLNIKMQGFLYFSKFNFSLRLKCLNNCWPYFKTYNKHFLASQATLHYQTTLYY